MKEINLTTKIGVYLIEECSEVEKKLIEAAKNATKNAYAPYSEFRVGAAVLLQNGKIVSGNNQENAAYPSGLCAERTTIFFSNASFPDQKIEAIAIAAYYNGRFTNDAVTPCGACRQVLLETENRFKSPIKVLMYSNEAVYTVNSIKDLLPLSFGDRLLKS
ncbi:MULTISPECIES: cytidine deaminase [Proteiniphilum]|jgi:cytidine deaminase|uniref:cytidine deaminase n=1 Tax=Proteiniphilum TaxID=294702 RepID=UPI001EEBC9F2|nr:MULTISPECIES: cytidine deaminase [Proteiniphilum]ULB34397.1 cytidine deaminase [Proteiniphilum propionicum]